MITIASADDNIMNTTHPHPRKATVILALLLTVAVAGCGSSSTQRTTRAPIATSTATTPIPLPAKGGLSASAGAFRATLNGENHTPKVSQPWPYSLKVTNATGQPVTGTASIAFMLAGVTVAYDKPPTHPIINGVWQSTLKFPKTALGYPLTLRAVVHTHTGSITLNWPITVQP